MHARKKSFISLLILLITVTVFAFGTIESAGASSTVGSKTMDEQTIVSLINRALVCSGQQSLGTSIITKGSYKIVLHIYTGGKEFSTTTEPPKPKPRPKTANQPAIKPIPPNLQPKPQPKPSVHPQPKPAAPAVQALNADEQKMLKLVNAERIKAGLKPLQTDIKLIRLARLKAQDMITKNYFAHTSPTYGSPFDMMKGAGVTYYYAGENLAGAPSVDIAHTNLMNSPGHRANILNANFNKIGLGVISGGPYGKMFVQMFTD